MEVHITKIMGAAGTSRRMVVYTHTGAGKDDKPAVFFDSSARLWSIDHDSPLTPNDFTLVAEAIADMKERIASVEAALASEKHG